VATVVTVTANPLLNFICEHRVEAGTVNRVPGCAVSAEGKGVNVARLMVAHGHHAIACGFAGGHTGALLTDTVAASGVAVAFTPTASRLRVGFQATPADDDHPTTLLEHGFALTEAECAHLLDTVSAHLSQADLVIASGSVPDPIADGLYVELLARCAAAKVPCWIDAYGPAMDAAVRCPNPPAVSKPNRQEYGSSAHWDRVREVHLSDGGAGVEVHHPDGRFKVHPAPVTQVNPVGSGDCYLAGLAHGRLSNWPLERQLRYAAAAGAANAARSDVAMIAPAEAEALVASVQIEALS
jgi:fructose-1-phosphate kinase PfkB-like protein